MALRKPQEFFDNGSKVFRQVPVSRELIQGWVGIANEKARDAANTAISSGTRLAVAYECVFTLSLAVLNSNGWRATAADGHHKEGLEAACALAGVSVTQFDDMDAVRDLRNDQYRAKSPVEADVELALNSMNAIAPRLLAVVAQYLR